jgi:4-hydroxybenzoyl-CoA thioesterase
MLVSRRSVTVEWGDCDPAEIVFYPRYFAWFDASTANHFKVAGLPKPELRSRYGVVGFPMVDTRARFFVPSKFGDEIVIETRIASFGRSSFDVEHRILKGDTLAVEGFEKRVLVAKSADGEKIKSVAIPADVIALFRGRAGDR